MKTAAIDLGSSFIKAALLDMETGHVRDMRKVVSPSKIDYEDNLLYEVPVQRYVDIVKGFLECWSRQEPDLKSLVLSTQMHGFVYVTEDTGEAVYISWQDMRCLHRKNEKDTYLSWFQKRFSKKDMENCGVYIKPSLGMCNLYTLLEENPNIRRNGTLYTLGSYVICQLTGNNICHITNAAPWGLVDVKHGCWFEEMIEALGMSDIKFPTLAERDYVSCGNYNVNGCNIQVFPDYGDQQIAVLGSMAEKGYGLINIATAGQVSRLSDTFRCGEYEVRPYFEGRYLNTISNMPSGRGLDVLVKFLIRSRVILGGDQMTVGEFWKVVEKQFVFDTKGIQVDMSFYATPEKLDGGEIRGITAENLDINSLFSAAFYDMAKTYQRNLQILAGEEMEGIICSGGVSWKRPELVHIIQQVTQKPCRLSALDDEALAGLYRVALCCNRICSDLEEEKDNVLKLG